MRRTWGSVEVEVLRYDIHTNVATVSFVGVPISWLNEENKRTGRIDIPNVGIVLKAGSRMMVQWKEDAQCWWIIDVEP